MKTQNQASAWTPGYTANRLDIEGLGEHALLHPIPDPCKLTAHWIIARSRLLALAPEMAEALANCVRSISLALNEHSNRRPKGLTGQMPERWLELSKQLTVTRALLARLEGNA